MSNKVTVTPQQRSEPELRKLARALISIARRQLQAEAAATEPSPKAVKPRPGEAA